MKFIRYCLLIMLGVTGIATADVDYNRRMASDCGSCYECSCNPYWNMLKINSGSSITEVIFSAIKPSTNGANISVL